MADLEESDSDDRSSASSGASLDSDEEEAVDDDASSSSGSESDHSSTGSQSDDDGHLLSAKYDGWTHGNLDGFDVVAAPSAGRKHHWFYHDYVVGDVVGHFKIMETVTEYMPMSRRLSSSVFKPALEARAVLPSSGKIQMLPVLQAVDQTETFVSFELMGFMVATKAWWSRRERKALARKQRRRAEDRIHIAQDDIVAGKKSRDKALVRAGQELLDSAKDAYDAATEAARTVCHDRPSPLWLYFPLAADEPSVSVDMHIVNGELVGRHMHRLYAVDNGTCGCVFLSPAELMGDKLDAAGAALTKDDTAALLKDLAADTHTSKSHSILESALFAADTAVADAMEALPDSVLAALANVQEKTKISMTALRGIAVAGQATSVQDLRDLVQTTQLVNKAIEESGINEHDRRRILNAVLYTLPREDVVSDVAINREPGNPIVVLPSPAISSSAVATMDNLVLAYGPSAYSQMEKIAAESVVNDLPV